MAVEMVIARPGPVRRAARFGGLMRALVRRPDGLIGLSILIFFAVIAIAPEFFVGKLETAVTGLQSGNPRLSPPIEGFLFGTDEKRRDLFNVTVHGARV